jgi:hypothetical protein
MECRNQKERETTANGSHLFCPDYWTRESTRSECGTGTQGALDQIPFRTAAAGYSQARVPIRSNLFIDYGKRGADNRSGDTPRESGEEKSKRVKLKH